MHFSKTYAQLLLSLPPDLRDNGIQYRQLKKLINQVVLELSSLGLSPAVLQELLESPEVSTRNGAAPAKGKEREVDSKTDSTSLQSLRNPPYVPKVVYELNVDSDHIEPRLRLWVNLPDTDIQSPQNAAESDQISDTDDDGKSEVIELDNRTGGSHTSLLWALQRREGVLPPEVPQVTYDELSSPIGIPGKDGMITATTNVCGSDGGGSFREVVIPLTFDTAFFQLLSTALQSLSAHLTVVHSNFVATLEDLSRSIASSARPISSTSSFRPHSVLSNPASIRTPFLATSITARKSDLYSWREIFQLYVEAEVFESVSEADRGERPVQDSEHRLKLFAERVTQRGLGDGRKLKLKQSRAALERFLEINIFILNVKKFQLANAEAIRKILKKHTKRTALPLPSTATFPTFSPPQLLPDLVLLPQSSTSLPHILVQAVGETLLPIIPHLDDYTCLICTSIAFKPIRLFCGHLFCVRCLVKMQKRGNGDCPMCRAPSVLRADRSNVDWALLNFMQDWFPTEAKAKLRANEREAAEEEFIELGLDPKQPCVIM